MRNIHDRRDAHCHREFRLAGLKCAYPHWERFLILDARIQRDEIAGRVKRWDHNGQHMHLYSDPARLAAGLAKGKALWA